MKSGPQSSFLVQCISMAPWFPASSVCSFLISVHGKCPLPPSKACLWPALGFLGDAPNHLLLSPPLSALCQRLVLQDAAESSLSWECTATLLQEDPAPHSAGQFPQSRAGPGFILWSLQTLLHPTLCTDKPDRALVYHTHIVLYLYYQERFGEKTHWKGLNTFSNRATLIRPEANRTFFTFPSKTNTGWLELLGAQSASLLYRETATGLGFSIIMFWVFTFIWRHDQAFIRMRLLSSLSLPF